MKRAPLLIGLVVAAEAIVIVCTGCAVDENAKYRDNCRYCGGDGFVGADDIQHARSENYPDAAQWKVGLCPYCQTGKGLLAPTAPPQQQARSAPAVPATYQQQPAAPLPEPRIETTENMGYVDSAGRCFVYGYLYNDTNRVLIHATVACSFLSPDGTQIGTQFATVSYLQPGGKARWTVKTPIKFTMQYRVAGYSYGN